MEPEVEERLSVVLPRAGERVQDAMHRSSEATHLRNQIALALAAMDHNGLAMLRSWARVEMPVEPRLRWISNGVCSR